MKKIVKSLLVVMLLCVCSGMYAQDKNGQQESIPFALVDEKPTFNGGDVSSSFTLWVFSQIKYPEEAFKNNIQGRVTLKFLIAKEDGKVKDVSVLRSSGNRLLDDEALRVVSMSPAWTPGKAEGKAVDVTYVFPVVFQTKGSANASDSSASTITAEGAREPVPFALVEQKPTFMGKDPNPDFTKWMFAEIKYPEEAKKNKIQGRTTLQFVISKTGKVKDVKVVKSSGSEILDNEAVRVISMSPDWEPGKMKGKAVDVKFTYPVVFILR